MRKITEIKIEQEYMKSERDEFGNRVKVPATGLFDRNPEIVTQGARFAHFIIDVIIFYVLSFIAGIVLVFTVPDLLGSDAIINVITYLIFFLYYFITEATMQRSIGKFITGTVVINEYADKPSMGSVAIRSISRLIPFEAFSCLSETGWHDKFSKTFVVKKSEALELKRLLMEMDGKYLSNSSDLLD